MSWSTPEMPCQVGFASGLSSPPTVMLNVCTKELKERIMQKGQWLKQARESQTELCKQDRSFFLLTVISAVGEDSMRP